MQISVIVPAYNEEKYIAKCLSSLNSQNDKKFELIVVDNNSKDQTNKIAKKFTKNVITEKKPGYHHAVNTGIKQSKGNIIAVCDADTIYPKDWIRTIKRSFPDDCSGIYGYVDFYDASPILRFLSKNALYLFMMGIRIFEIDVCNGLNFIFRKKDYLAVGGYDPKIYNNNLMDINLGTRLKTKGKLRFVRSLKAKTSLRRVKNQGLGRFIKKSLKAYHSYIKKGKVKESYEEYNQEYR